MVHCYADKSWAVFSGCVLLGEIALESVLYIWLQSYCWSPRKPRRLRSAQTLLADLSSQCGYVMVVSSQLGFRSMGSWDMAQIMSTTPKIVSLSCGGDRGLKAKVCRWTAQAGIS